MSGIPFIVSLCSRCRAMRSITQFMKTCPTRPLGRNGKCPISRPESQVVCPARATSTAISAPSYRRRPPARRPGAMALDCDTRSSGAEGCRRRVGLQLAGHTAADSSPSPRPRAGLEPRVLRGHDVPVAHSRHAIDRDASIDAQVESLGVPLEVIRHFIFRRKGPAVRRKRHPREPIEARRRKESQRVPPVAPYVADPSACFEDHKGHATFGEMISN
jgi:hypothetical protein